MESDIPRHDDLHVDAGGFRSQECFEEIQQSAAAKVVELTVTAHQPPQMK